MLKFISTIFVSSVLRNPVSLHALLNYHRCTRLTAVPSLLRLLFARTDKTTNLFFASKPLCLQSGFPPLPAHVVSTNVVHVNRDLCSVPVASNDDSGLEHEACYNYISPLWPFLRVIISSGEALTVHLARQIFTDAPGFWCNFYYFLICFQF